MSANKFHNLSDIELAVELAIAQDRYLDLVDETRRRFEHRLRAAFGPELRLVGDIYVGSEDKVRSSPGNLRIAWCFYCGVRPGWQRDHKIPKKRGGSDHRSNIARCCQSCNSRKGNLTLEEYRSKIERRTGRPQVFFGEKPQP